MRIVDAIGWTLLHFLWEGSLIGLIYAALRSQFRNPQVRYVLGLIALAACALAPVATLSCLWPSQSPVEAIRQLPDRFVSATGFSAGAVSWQRVDVALPWLVGLWCGGVLIVGLLALREWWRLACARRNATKVEAWRGPIEALAARFGIHRPIALLSTAAVEAPTLLGVFKPVILVPAALLLRLPPAQLELILAHELCHVRRWDYLANLAQVVLETFLFYHPAVHWLSSRVRVDREMCCDQTVLAMTDAAPRRYAQALAELAEAASYLAPAASGGVLIERIEILLDVPRAQRAAFAWLPLASVAIVCLLALGVQQMTGRTESRRAPDISTLSPPTRLLPQHQVPSSSSPNGGWAAVERSQPIASTLPAAQSAAAPMKLHAGSEHATETVHSRMHHALPQITAAGEKRHTNVLARSDEIAPAAAPIFSTAKIEPDLAGSPSPPRVALRIPDHVVETTAPPVPAIDQTPQAEQIGAPRVTHFVAPVYPTARDDDASTRIGLQFTVNPEGTVQEVSVYSGNDHAQLARAATAALRQWRFATDSVQPGRIYRQTIDFDAANAGPDCRVPTGSHICRRDLGDAGVAR